MTNPLTLNLIKSTLSKSGINSKQLVIDRLNNLDKNDILSLKRELKELENKMIMKGESK